MSNIIYQAETSAPSLEKILFVGMDIHKDNHTACLADCFGRKLMTVEIENTKNDFKQLVKEVRRLSRASRLDPIFGLEDCYGNGLRAATYLKQAGFEVKTVSPVEVDRKRRYATHPEKSDSLDALGVAKVLIEKIDSLPDYSISKQDKLSKQLRELNNDRQYLIKEQTRLKNQLHAILHKSYGSDYKKIFKNIFTIKALKYWHRRPAPNRRNDDGLVDHDSILKNQIRRKANRLLAIKKELKEIEKELKMLIGQTGQKLETLNGCGTVLAAQVLAEIRSIDRFSSPSCLAKYAGLSPRQKSSGKKEKHIKDRGGNRRLNNAIHGIALSQIGRNGNQFAKDYFQRKIKEGKSKIQSLCCLKRQLVNIIYVMLKNSASYDYHRAAN
jgi:transposase